MKRPLENILLKLPREQLEITQDDLIRGRIGFERELIDPLEFYNLFRHAIFIILTFGDNYRKSITINNELINNGFTRPDLYRRSNQKLRRILEKQGWNETRVPRIYNFVDWFKRSDLPKKIIEDGKKGNNHQFELRDQIAREAMGLELKGSSLLVNQTGGADVVCIDIWAQRYVQALGEPIKCTDYKTIGGPRGSDYYAQERFITDLASKAGVRPAIYKAAIWEKRAYWKRVHNEAKQIS